MSIFSKLLAEIKPDSVVRRVSASFASNALWLRANNRSYRL